MKCPLCGGQIYENYEELKTVDVVAIAPDGLPVTGDDYGLHTSDAYSYNCAHCGVEWETWEELLAEVEANK